MFDYLDNFNQIDDTPWGTRPVPWFLILGTASAVAGVGLLLFGKSASN